LQVFRRNHGDAALQFACHAAFPLTLTSDLLYCLWQQDSFGFDCPWHTVADVLLSGLCRPVGHDLYEMEGITRRALLDYLKCLHEPHHKARFQQLEQFMQDYIQGRLGEVQTPLPTALTVDRPGWVSLACFRSAETMRSVMQQIRKALQDAIERGDFRERLRLVSVVERYADLIDPLAELNYRPILLDWLAATEAGSELADVDIPKLVASNTRREQELAQLSDALGISFEPFTFETASLDDGMPPGLEADEVETVRVNGRGEVIETPRHAVYFFEEPLEDGPPLRMMAIRSGQFWMGSPEDELQRRPSESPRHQVTVPPFFISQTPITQAQWKAIAALPQIERNLTLDPSSFKGDDRPVERVNWHSAVEFCRRLSKATGRTYRLPSEAEWEYACRAGSETPFYFGETITTELANYDGNYTYGDGPKGDYRQQTTPVGQFPSNANGLYDMHGNVYEWCEDRWHENYENAPIDGRAWIEGGESNRRVTRGGSWNYGPRNCRSAYRSWDGPAFDLSNLGIRVVCSAPGFS
jgi:formylglycine-generating enzyme required for sulfatase activity